MLSSGASANQLPGKPEVEGRSQRGTIAYIPHSVTGGYTHRVRAIDPFRVVGIEFIASGGPKATQSTATPDAAELVFPQGRITRAAIAPGSTRQIAGSLIVAASSGTLTRDDREWTFKEGDVRWIGDQPASRYANHAMEPVSLLVLTLGQ